MEILAKKFMKKILFCYLQSLIRTAEQLKIKGLCEINDHTSTTESDSEVIYPPHKKIRASRNYENNNSLANSNRNLSESTSKSSANATDKDAQQSITSHEESKHKSKSPIKESKSASNSTSTQQGKNMASLDMGMVSRTRNLSSP